MTHVKIIAPSFKSKDHEVLLTKTLSFLSDMGFSIDVDPNIYGDSGFYANSFDFRLRDLRKAIVDEKVDIIWALSGGYGAGEIADLCLDISPPNNKILIGYSDITVLHQLFNSVYQIPSLHASVLSGIVGAQRENAPLIIDTLRGAETKIKLTPVSAHRSVNTISEIQGGNLCVLSTLLGTKLQPNFKNKIVVLEDLDEPGYRIMRYFNHLMKSGAIDETSTIVLGDFINSDEYFEYVIKEFTDRYKNICVFTAEGIGHGVKNIPIVLGTECAISNNTLTIPSPFRIS